MRATTKAFRARSKVLKEALRTLTGAAARDERRSLERVHRIAREQASTDFFTIRTQPLRVRKRVGLFLHEVLAPRDGVVMRIVEKRCNSPNEGRFYSNGSANRQARDAIAPRVYFIRRRSRLALPEFQNHIFIEHLPSIGLPDRTPTTARMLARRMIKIAELPRSAQWPLTYAPLRFDVAFLEDFIKVVRDGGLVEKSMGDAKLADMRSNWHFLQDGDATATQMVPCHNDLHGDNIGRRATGDFIFLDWGQFAINRLGADLHHFLSLGLQKREWSGFAAAVCDDYCKLAEEVFGTRRRSTDFAAHSFALYKCMYRAIRQNGSDASLSFATVAVMLYDRLRAQPL